MKLLTDGSVQQPITVAVGVVLAILAGLIAFTRVPIQLAPQVASTVITVNTFWPNATPLEVESDIIEEQEAVLANIEGLESIISTASRGSGEIRLSFRTGTDIDEAAAAVDQRIAQVPFYPDGVSNPEIEKRDPQSIDYIAWVGLSSSDPDFDAYTLGDFMDRVLKPRFERIPGISEVGGRGSRMSEIHIDVDADALAQRGITWGALVATLQANNRDASGGNLQEGKRDIRLMAQGRFRDPAEVEQLVLRRDAGGTIRLGDIANVQLAYQEPTSFVRIRGVKMPVFNFQLAQDGNLLATMAELQAEFAAMNQPDGILAREAQRLGLNGTLNLIQVYDAAEYVQEAIDLVQSNILMGGALAIITLLLFLKSLRTVGIIALAIPISVIASVTVLTALGRTVNLISLAGFAFSVGMVVDNAIVVIENIYRHLEMGKNAKRAARDGAREVASAVFASTMTTLVVFLPILLIEDTAGQLFRDVALAIMAAVALSLLVSLTVIPAAASRVLKQASTKGLDLTDEQALPIYRSYSGWIGRQVHRLISSSWDASVAILITAVTISGIYYLKPPMDYLPSGNRNLAFGLVFAPPGFSQEHLNRVGDRIVERVRPFFEATEDTFPAEAILRGDREKMTDHRHVIRDRGQEVMPPGLKHYFMGSFSGLIFHGGVAEDPTKAVDIASILRYASSSEAATDMFGIAFQPPIFRVAGTTGSAIRINLSGENLAEISAAGGAVFGRLMREFGPGKARPTPSNFLSPTPQIGLIPNDERLIEAGLNRQELARALQAAGDGIRLVKSFVDQSELKDIIIRSQQAHSAQGLQLLDQLPIATPQGGIVDLGSLVTIEQQGVADQIQRVDRERAVTIELTPPDDLALESAIEQVDGIITELTDQGAIPPSVFVSKTGSAGNLNAIQTALTGDGTWLGLITSSLFLAVLVVYFGHGHFISKLAPAAGHHGDGPPASLGGFAGLAIMHHYSLSDRYTPVINLDVLTILGFVILAGVVVNNAILIVTQTRNLIHSHPDIEITRLISTATASRVRPIAMSMATSIGGILPLVLLPGSGSELYRGLGAVLVGGLAMSTIFTLVLVPILLSWVMRPSK